MDFHQAFLDSLLTSTPLTKSNLSTEHRIKSLSVPEEITEILSYIQAYGAIHVLYPFCYEISKLDSFCLIYTKKGSGLLTLDNRSYTLNRGTIAFVNCSQRHRIEVKQSSWSYNIFFISGSPVSFFYSSFIENNSNLHTFLPGSTIPDKIALLYDFLSKSPGKSLIHAKYISDILFELLLEKSRLYEMNPCICNYIYEIKHDLDYNYMDNITLEHLEQKYHISKYQICREFTKCFHISPIKYLNHRKIEAAKEVLLNTGKRINEVGRMVGFENPNNLIRQFKKQTGVTPLEYRKQSQAWHADKECTSI